MFWFYHNLIKVVDLKKEKRKTKQLDRVFELSFPLVPKKPVCHYNENNIGT